MNQIGNFLLEKPLQFGQWTEVWRARWLKAPAPEHQIVALKILRIEFVLDHLQIERFNNEIRAMCNLHHPHIALPMTWGLFDDGRRYFATQFIQGQPLSDWLNDKPLPPHFVISILYYVSQGLDYLHQNSIVHRDIKPENILITSQGIPYLVDFSVALSPEVARLTGVGQLVGTAAYMPPEIIVAKPITPMTDIYSLGVLAYQMLTGKLPFEGNQLEVTYKHVNVPAPLPSAVNPALSKAVDQSLLWALAKQPNQRPQTASAFTQHLKRALANRSSAGGNSILLPILLSAFFVLLVIIAIVLANS